jgi:hypothetical protein
VRGTNKAIPFLGSHSPPSSKEINVTATLNEGQSAAAEAFFAFLLSDEKEFIISGPGGVGKTFLITYLIDQIMPRYFKTCELMGLDPKYKDVQLTATTNKAAEVIGVATQRPTGTIHSFLNLIVREDFSTGALKLTRTDAWKIHEDMIIFVDECSMMDAAIRKALHEATLNCKIVYVGDHCQLPPITEPISPIYRDNLPFVELTEQMRSPDQPAIMQACLQLRHTVETGEFFPIQIVPGVIDHFDDEEMENAIATVFAGQTHGSRILAYTNSQVNLYNSHIRELRMLSSEYAVGEYLVNNSAIRVGKLMISVEEELEIFEAAKKTTLIEIEKDVELEVRYCTMKLRRGALIEKVPVPVDRDHFLALIKYYQKNKNWKPYFHLKNNYPDLRPRDASTVHKAQGSTYDIVFIDLANISTCHNPNHAARMLYVAFSRPRQRIILYGQLADKYGGLIK